MAYYLVEKYSSIQKTREGASWITQVQLSPGDETNKQTIKQLAESKNPGDETNKLSSSWSESLKSFLVLLNVVDDKYSGDTSDGLLE